MKKILSTLCLLAAAFTAQAQTPFGGTTSTDDVAKVCGAVADWQIANFGMMDNEHHNLSWTNGALYRGMFEWAEQTDSQACFDFLKEIGERNEWRLLKRAYHADDICVGQYYIEMYRRYGEKKMLQPLLERAYYVANHPSDAPLSKRDKIGQSSRWSWCDALFMAPPVYAALYRQTGEQCYFDYMDSEFRVCTDSLYDAAEHLYYRDCKRIGVRESNGAKQFWGRGNGWVFAGIPLVLEELSADNAARGYYIDIFCQMAESVLRTQDKDGAWHASLLDADAYPMPENSASAFFCYGIAWGLRNGLLKGRKYEKALEKGWRSLVSYVSADGKLGYIQPVGASPRSVGADSTDVYGVGAFLLAGTEIIRLNLAESKR